MYLKTVEGQNDISPALNKYMLYKTYHFYCFTYAFPHRMLHMTRSEEIYSSRSCESKGQDCVYSHLEFGKIIGIMSDTTKIKVLFYKIPILGIAHPRRAVGVVLAPERITSSIVYGI